MRALNEHLGAAPLIVDAVNPGFCASELNRNISGFLAVIGGVMTSILAFTPEEGSRRLVHAAVGMTERPDALRGAYLNECRVEEPSNFVISPEGRKAQDLIWVRSRLLAHRFARG